MISPLCGRMTSQKETSAHSQYGTAFHGISLLQHARWSYSRIVSEQCISVRALLPPPSRAVSFTCLQRFGCKLKKGYPVIV